ncbi:MAG TPA: PQQ-binding-like beta-propeller repeat protein, partial [Gemmataceae bacterium]|nr:PQQ-binding-like beta-propeller repeat protein [Gemmataceae bacterium]
QPGVHRLIVWDPATGKEVRRLECDRSQPSGAGVAHSADGKVLAWGTDHSVVLWDAASGKEPRKIDAETVVQGVGLSPDGKLAVACCNKEVRVWEIATGRLVSRRPLAEGSVKLAAFTPDGKTLVAAPEPETREPNTSPCRIFLFDVIGGKVLHRLIERDDERIEALAITPDGKTVATVGLSKTSLRLWDAATGKELLPVGGHQRPILDAAFTPDGRRVVTSSWDETTRVWEAATGKELRQLPGRFVRVRPGGKSLLTLTVQKELMAHLWDLETGKELGRAPLPRGGGEFDEGGTTLAVPDENDTVRLLDLATGKERGRLAEGKGRPSLLALSADGQRLASWRADRLTLWDVTPGKALRTFGAGELGTTAEDWSIAGIALSPDGALLAARYHNKRVLRQRGWRVWEAATGQEWPRLKGEQSLSVGDPLFSHDGRTLITSSYPHQVRFWEVATGGERRRLDVHPGGVYALSRDGRFLVTGDHGTAALVWDLRPAGGPLTADALKAAWADLASDDATRAYQAILRLAADPEQAVPFLNKALPPVAPADEKRVARLVADLDSDDFDTRQAATQELGRVGEATAAALRKALAGRPSEEVRRRAELLLERWGDPAPRGEALRAVRAVEALEQAGTDEARDLMRRLADGADGAHLTRAAKAALRRLTR